MKLFLVNNEINSLLLKYLHLENIKKPSILKKKRQPKLALSY